MAARLSLPEVDLTCPICCDIFREPVVLKCSHSFCSPCLQQYWGQKRPGGGRDCPLCRAVSTDEPVPSLALRNLCESWMAQEGEDPAEGQAPAGELMCEPGGEMCPVHGERLKLFCLVDKEPICVVCHTARKHKRHDCCPISEAAADMKEKMKSVLDSLQGRKDAFDQMKKNYEDTVAHIQVQARFVELQTREEFQKLHSFLQAQEDARMEELRREEEEKKRGMMQRIEELERNMASVLASIRELEEEMALEDIAVLHKYKGTIQGTLQSVDCPAEESTSMPPAALIDVGKHIGSLSFHVWQKMHEIVKYTPVTLDPNTAAPWLSLSDDLASVCDSDERRNLPNNPERFDPDTAVLGSEGFASGRHSWDVNVGDNTAWVVGVAKESVLRKKKVSSVLGNGYICVYFYHNMYFAGTSPLTRLTLKKNPQRVRVLLDADKGRVSFYNPQDNTHIYTFKLSIADKVFPYFWVGCQQCPLTVEPQEVSVKILEYF